MKKKAQPKLRTQCHLCAALIFLFLSAVPLWSQIPAPQVEAPQLEAPQSDGQQQVDSPQLGSPQTKNPALQSEGLNGPQNVPDAEVFLESAELRLRDDGLAKLSVTYDFPEGFHQSKQEDFFTVTLPEASPFRVNNIGYPENGVEEQGVLNYYGSATLEVELSLDRDVSPGTYRVPITASYQLCDDAGTCFFPQDAALEVSITVPEGVEATEPLAAGTGDSAGGAADNGQTSPLMLLQFLLFAFIGGLLLNVMPCVLPVLSIRALNLVKQSNNKRSEIFKGSLFYTLGVILSLILLAAVVIALKLSGELVGWGFQFQNPLFTVFLIVVVFTFALSLFDVYVFQAPAMNGAVQKASQKGYLGSFFNGIIAVLLATPCTAPLLGTALGFAFSQSPLMILAIFSLVGLGFAFPFLLIGIWPKAIQNLPKPGAWMNTFKELMGFVLFGTAIYLLSILKYQISSAEMLQVLTFLLLLGFFLWIYGKTAKPTSSRKRKWIILILFIILSVSAAGRLLQFEGRTDSNETTSTSIREDWQEFSPELLSEYRNSGTPVLVIFSAKWCTVCKMNEETVLKTDRASQLFEQQGVQVLYGDYTNQDPVIGEWIQSYGRAGVPVYAYYSEGSSYILLPEVLSFQVLEDRLGSSP